MPIFVEGTDFLMNGFKPALNESHQHHSSKLGVSEANKIQPESVQRQGGGCVCIKSTKRSGGEKRKGQRNSALLCGNGIILVTEFKGASTHVNQQ